MEFNVLPRAKILSPHSTHKTSQTTNQTVNVILPQADNKPPADNAPNPPQPTPPTPLQPVDADVNPYQALQPGEVHYDTRDVKLNEPAEQLTNEDKISTINFLKLVLESYMNNPIKYNGYIICTVPLLENLIETLTSCDDCDVQISDIETKCCGTSKIKIVPVTKIWVRNGDTTELFKYKYSQFLQVFEQYHISLKFIYVE